LRGCYPDHHILWVASETSQLETAFVPAYPRLIDSFYCGSGWGERPVDLIKPLPAPLRRRFDLVIDTQGLLWRSLLAWRIPAKVFVSSCGSFALSRRKPAPERRKPRHVVDRLLSLLEAATGQPVAAPPLGDWFKLPPDALAEATALLPPGPDYVALAPGAGKRHKCWPLDNFIALARHQAVLGRVPVFLLGPAELDWIAALQAAVPQARFPLQTPGLSEPRYTPFRTMAIAAQCRLAVGADCGLTHILTGADIPLVVLFGPTSAAKLHPRVRHGRWIEAGHYGPDKAMSQIPLTAVTDAVEALLA
jgi:ADP-heptose:LPS heptosyltransferase